MSLLNVFILNENKNITSILGIPEEYADYIMEYCAGSDKIAYAVAYLFLQDLETYYVRYRDMKGCDDIKQWMKKIFANPNSNEESIDAFRSYLKEYISGEYQDEDGILHIKFGNKVIEACLNNPDLAKTVQKYKSTEDFLQYVTLKAAKKDPDQKKLYTFDDGFYWIEVPESEQGRDKEVGLGMKHCGMPMSNGIMLSLKDKNGRPHVSAEVEDIGGGFHRISQVKGGANTAPKERYWPYIKVLKDVWAKKGSKGMYIDDVTGAEDHFDEYQKLEDYFDDGHQEVDMKKLTDV